MRRYILIICWLLAIISSGTAQTLEETKACLEPTLAGAWRIEPKATPAIGPMLVYTPYPTNTWPGFVGFIPFGQDPEGQQKIELYLSTCQAPLYVLGFTTNLTVITYLQRTDQICQKISTLLHLTLPPSASDSDL